MTDPVWVDPADSHFSRLEETIEADVAIIGGGLSGIGAAYALHRTGADVVLLEERTLASGASGRNAGFVLAGPAMPFPQACERFGEAATLDMWRLTVENNRLMACLIDELTLDCGYMRRGSMSLAATGEEMIELVDTSRALHAVGIATCSVARSDLPRPFENLYQGGIYYPGNAEMNPAQFVRGVAREVQSGVRIFEDTSVHELRLGTPHILRTALGTVRARAVVLATNAYTSRLLAGVPIAPVRGQVMASAPLDHVVVPFPMYADRGYQYWRQTPDGRLIIGGWRNVDLSCEVGTEERLHPGIHSTLDHFCGVVTRAEAHIEKRWAGIMGFTPDHVPLVGSVPGCERVHIAAGYSGHGVSMAFTCGGRAARQALGEQVDVPAAFNPARLATDGCSFRADPPQ